MTNDNSGLYLINVPALKTIFTLITLFCSVMSAIAKVSIIGSEGTAAASRGFSFTGSSDFDSFGDQVTGIGDFNDDGFNDLVIGGSCSGGYNCPVYVIFGNSNNNLMDIDIQSTDLSETHQGFRIMPNGVWENFGISLAGAGDVNGDRIDDIIIGAYALNQMVSITIFGGKNIGDDIDLSVSDLATTNKGFILTADIPGILSVSVMAGDFNNDGINDIIALCIGSSYTKGYAYIYFGKRTGLIDVDLTAIDLIGSQQGFTMTITGASNILFGRTCTNIGDINNDGIDDFAIGGYEILYIFFGKTSGFANINLDNFNLVANQVGFKITGVAVGPSLGTSVSGAGDINNDGIDDILVGASASDSNKGTTFVIFGKNGAFANINLATTDLSASQQGFQITGAAGDTLGSSVSFLNDQNNDGIDDMLIGAYGSGTCYVIYGKSDISDIDLGVTSLSVLDLGFRITGQDGNSGGFGQVVTNAGDFNGDGVDDIVIAAPSSKIVYTIVSDTSSVLEKLVQVATLIYNILVLICCTVCNSSSVVIMVSIMSKLVQAIKYLDLPYPFKLQSFIDASNGDLLNFNIPEDINRMIVSKKLPTIFVRNSVDGSFLNNFWGMIIILGGLLSAWICLKMMHYLFVRINKQKENTISTLLKTVYRAALSFFIIQMYGNIGDIFFFTVLQIKSATFQTPLSSLSFALSIIFTAFGVALLALHGRFLLRYRSIRKMNSDLSNKILETFITKNDYLKLLHHDFKDTALDKHSFIFILVAVDILVGLMSSLMLTHPLSQSIILVIFSVLLFVHLAWRRPLRERFDQVTEFFLQVCVVIVFTCVLIFALITQKDSPSEKLQTEQDSLALGIMIVIIIIKIASFVPMVAQIIHEVKGVYKYLVQRKRIKVQAISDVKNGPSPNPRLDIKNHLGGNLSPNTTLAFSSNRLVSPLNLTNINSARSSIFVFPSDKYDAVGETGLPGNSNIKKLQNNVDSSEELHISTSVSIKLDQNQESVRMTRFVQNRRDIIFKKSYQVFDKTPKSKFAKVHSEKDI